jgi:hypothetical protein
VRTGKPRRDEIARELGWDEATLSVICTECASLRVEDDPKEEPTGLQ